MSEERPSSEGLQDQPHATPESPKNPPAQGTGRFASIVARRPVASVIVVALIAFFVGMGAGGSDSTQQGLGSDEGAGLASRVADLEGENADLKTEASALEDRNAELLSEVGSLQDKARSAKQAQSKAERASANNAPGIHIDFAQWDGLFTLKNATLDFGYDYASVLGQLEYLGGGDCKLGYVEVNATFFNGGKLIGTGLWNTDTLTAGSPAVDVSGETTTPADRADVVMTDASCG